jgi:hypothetical protein
MKKALAVSEKKVALLVKLKGKLDAKLKRAVTKIGQLQQQQKQQQQEQQQAVVTPPPVQRQQQQQQQQPELKQSKRMSSVSMAKAPVDELDAMISDLSSPRNGDATTATAIAISSSSSSSGGTKSLFHPTPARQTAYRRSGTPVQATAMPQLQEEQSSCKQASSNGSSSSSSGASRTHGQQQLSALVLDAFPMVMSPVSHTGDDDSFGDGNDDDGSPSKHWPRRSASSTPSGSGGGGGSSNGESQSLFDVLSASITNGINKTETAFKHFLKEKNDD